MKYDKILKCKDFCNKCGECKRFLGKSTRKFCGHLYVDGGREDSHTKLPFEERIRGISCIERAEWQLERGREGNLHYQFFIEVNNPMKRSALKKLIPNFIEGEWIEPVACTKAQEGYVHKVETRVAGPWSYFPGEDDKYSAAYAARIRKSRVVSLGKELHERTTDDVRNCLHALWEWQDKETDLYVELQMKDLERRAMSKIYGY